MFCTQCGNELKEDDRFCSKCGKPVAAAPGTAPPPPFHVPSRHLRRIMSQKKIAGVCAGFAEYFDMDVTLMRIIFLALSVMPPGVGPIGYIIAWIAMPAE
jgi:phage shock protein C